MDAPPTWPAVISCHKFGLPYASFASWNQNKVSLCFGSNASTAGMEKSQWIRRTNAGFVIAASKLNLSFLKWIKICLKGRTARVKCWSFISSKPPESWIWGSKMRHAFKSRIFDPRPRYLYKVKAQLDTTAYRSRYSTGKLELLL